MNTAITTTEAETLTPDTAAPVRDAADKRTAEQVEIDTVETRSKLIKLFQEKRNYLAKVALSKGFASNDIEDALSETFEMAFRYAHTFDPNRGHIVTWLAFQILGKTVACRYMDVHTTDKDGIKKRANALNWRKQYSNEVSSVVQGEDGEEIDLIDLAGGTYAEQAESEMSATQFVALLADNLNETEQDIIQNSGLEVVSERLGPMESLLLQDKYNMTPYQLRSTLENLRAKVQTLAVSYFGKEAAAGRKRVRIAVA